MFIQETNPLIMNINESNITTPLKFKVIIIYSLDKIKEFIKSTKHVDHCHSYIISVSSYCF